MIRKTNPKTNWKRVPNTGPGQVVGNKYNFTQVLRKVGDFVETHPMSREEMYKIRFAVHIWAVRKHCRIKTQTQYHPDGQVGLLIELISHTRRKKQ